MKSPPFEPCPSDPKWFNGSTAVKVPVEKGYVWFTVEETITSPTTSPYAIGKAAA